jgi:hypothetical protein
MLEVTSGDTTVSSAVASFVEGPGAQLDRALSAQLLDARRILIVAQFRSYRNWVRAQRDAQPGTFLETIYTRTRVIEFNLYRCHHSDRSEKINASGHSS